MLLTLTNRTDMDGPVVADALRFQSAFTLVASLVLLSTFLFRLQMGLFDYPSAPVVDGAFLLILTSLCGLLASLRSDALKRITLFGMPFAQLVIVAGMIYYSGGALSSLQVLLLVPVISAMFISLPFALGVSLSGLALFIVIMIGEQAQWWDLIVRTGYTEAQRAAVNALRIILLFSVALSGMFLLLMHHMRRAYRLLEAREEDLFALAQTADEAFATALDSTVSDEARAALLQGRNAVRKATGVLESDSVPLARLLNVFTARTCNTCGARINRFSFYYGIPASERAARLMGNARNDVHCTTCHAAGAGECTVCAVWVKPVS